MTRVIRVYLPDEIGIHRTVQAGGAGIRNLVLIGQCEDADGSLRAGGGAWMEFRRGHPVPDDAAGHAFDTLLLVGGIRGKCQGKTDGHISLHNKGLKVHKKCNFRKI
jgi:hypothetical protein